jgi:hypothetical protein
MIIDKDVFGILGKFIEKEKNINKNENCFYANWYAV